MSSSQSNHYDIVILGGGMVGASMALALSGLPIKCAVLEAYPVQKGSQPSFDERNTALSHGSHNIFSTLGVWDSIKSHVTEIKDIHVSEQGQFGFSRINYQEQGVPSLGYVISNRVLGQALYSELEQSKTIELYCPAKLESLDFSSDMPTLSVLQNGNLHSMTCQLLIAADGVNSKVREQLGIATREMLYGQTAIVTNIETQKFHEHVAYERFTPSGPMAVLPISSDKNDKRCGLVWTVKDEQVEAVINLSDDNFLAKLSEVFGSRLGRLEKAGQRYSYPLKMLEAKEQAKKRCVILGNSAHFLHPVAGQGFNLSLRDVACLAELISSEIASSNDLGSDVLIKQYVEWRAKDQRKVIQFTDGLVRLFDNPLKTVKLFRNIGLNIFDSSPRGKKLFATHTMGLAGDLPKLARGVSLW